MYRLSRCSTLFWATVKAGTQERGMERRMEVRCKVPWKQEVRHDERACAHCEGAHGYRRNRQVYPLAA